MARMTASEPFSAFTSPTYPSFPLPIFASATAVSPAIFALVGRKTRDSTTELSSGRYQASTDATFFTNTAFWLYSDGSFVARPSPTTLRSSTRVVRWYEPDSYSKPAFAKNGVTAADLTKEEKWPMTTDVPLGAHTAGPPPRHGCSRCRSVLRR